MRKLPWKTLIAVFAASLVGLVVLCAGAVGPCWSYWIADGVVLDTCPVGAVRPVATVEAQGLGRNDIGVVTVGVTGHYVSKWGGYSTTPVRRFDTTLTLVAPDGTETPLPPQDGWESAWAHHQAAEVELPGVPDGDYVLRVDVDSPAGEARVEAPLPLYQPALAHVLTDAPLYKPGQDIRFRAVLFGAADLAPLDGRPAVWKVYDPNGELLLEEKAKAAAFGVVSGSFPLAPDAESGAWTVEVVSGPATDRVQVEVKPFQLPRFTVELSSPARFWRIGETPVVEGVARYTSGAPVASAPVRVRARAAGPWPPPPAWLEERTLTTDAKGRFRFEVGLVPADLRGEAPISWSAEVTDETGDSAGGGTTVLLSEDAIEASAVTELAGGLVPSANNRVYLRVTTPDGRILPGTNVHVSREWDAHDPGMDAVADADGVAKFQLDPGEPTTVVMPAMPVRPRPRASVDPIALSSADDALTGDSVDLEGRVALDRWGAALRACADRVAGGDVTVTTSALLGPDGRVRLVDARSGGETTPLSRCVAARLAGQSGPRGRDRLWTVRWTVRDPGVPSVEVETETLLGDLDDVQEALSDRVLDGRACVAREADGSVFPRAWRVSVTGGSTVIGMVPLAEPSLDGRVSAAAAACVERVVSGVRLSAPADESGVGLARLSVSAPAPDVIRPDAPRTFPGFALRVNVGRGDEQLGQTVLRLPVGAVPALRLRFSEVIVDPGATVELSAIRGPSWSGGFPEEMSLMQGDRELVKFPFDAKTRTATVTVPKTAGGFVHVAYGGARAVVYVRPPSTLALTLATDAASYRPGETAQLTVTARDGDQPVAAGVTLSGVDSTLATLAPLPNPDAFARVTVRATSTTPAFDVMDARALQTGQIAGENAAQAAVMRVDGLPTIPLGADRVYISRQTGTYTPDVELSDAFYALYRDARAEVRVWERSAAAGEVLTAKTMVDLWEKALSDHPAADPFGRQLHLSILPSDLLALTDPRFMTSDGARLPEDVENWSLFVSREAP